MSPNKQERQQGNGGKQLWALEGLEKPEWCGPRIIINWELMAMNFLLLIIKWRRICHSWPSIGYELAIDCFDNKSWLLIAIE